jgi:fatty acid desaturase
VIVACVYFRSILPAMYVGLPTLYGGWFALYCGMTQHLGLAEDVLDHRLNSRTVYMNPIFRFLYWNMNYHVEHHIFPTVPYHALPKLHEAIKGDCPPPYPSSIAAYREIIPALLRQLKDPTYFVRRELPPTAQPAAVGAVAVKAQRAI